MRERLEDLLNTAKVTNVIYTSDGEPIESYITRAVGEKVVPHLADHLLANGIVAPPVKVGQTVWVYNQSKNNVYENKVVCVKIMGTSKYKNRIVVEYHNQYGESSCRKYTWAQIGKQVFLTEQEAVEALAECLRKGATDDGSNNYF